jgi:hypothetical protein
MKLLVSFSPASSLSGPAKSSQRGVDFEAPTYAAMKDITPLVRRKSTDVSEEHVTSNCRVED